VNGATAPQISGMKKQIYAKPVLKKYGTLVGMTATGRPGGSSTDGGFNNKTT
jgi:hypothetical protein